MQKLKALLFADKRSFRNTELIELITRSGFEVDLITCSKFHYLYKNVNQVIFVKNELAMPAIAAQIADSYALKIVLGDEILSLIKNSNLTDAQKLSLLPINGLSSMGHICSKIELSKMLQKAQVNTPAFKVYDKRDSIIDSVKEVGYPALIKIDYSGGGVGVIKIDSESDLVNLPTHFTYNLLLIQKFISGKLLDLSAFFQNGKLIQFSCSESLKTINGPFGPSKLRIHHDFAQLNPLIINELEKLGVAIGANGFCNIGCIQSNQDNQRYYFEADMRPNDWVNYTYQLGDDPAIRFHDFFYHQKTFSNYLLNITHHKARDVFVNPSRLNIIEIITNKYHWIREDKLYSSLMYWLSLYLNPWEYFKTVAVSYIKPRVHARLWGFLKSQKVNYNQHKK